MDDLNELSIFIKNNCDLCISADTAVVHCCIEQGTPCIAIYQMAYFNLFSVQSIAEIFTRQSPLLIPLALYENTDSESNVIKSVKILFTQKIRLQSFNRPSYISLKAKLHCALQEVERAVDQKEYQNKLAILDDVINAIERLLPDELIMIMSQFKYEKILHNVVYNYEARYLVSYICKCSLLTKVDLVL